VDLAAGVARESGKKRITPRSVNLAIRSDQDFSALLADALVSGGGVAPHINKVLVKSKKKRKSKRSKRSGKKKSSSPKKAKSPKKKSKSKKKKSKKSSGKKRSKGKKSKKSGKKSKKSKSAASQEV